MLTALSIRNIILIDKLDLEFSDGLTVLTGETGAGKSILLDSLSLALGTRGDAALVRHGEKEASVTACFSVPMVHPVAAFLSANGYDFSGELIIRRLLGRDGRSRAFVNDTPVSIGFLKTIGDILVEIHGQFASHKLLNPATHLETLDSYGNLAEKRTKCRHAYQDWQYRKRERETAEQTLVQAKEEEAFLRTSVSDLEKLNPHSDEEETLTARRTNLMNSEKIVTALGHAYQAVSGEDRGGMHVLGEALSHLERANNWADGGLESLTEELSQAISLITDVSAELEKEQEKWGDVSELPAIDDRLFALRDMARKHQVSISELPNLLEKLRKQLTQLELGETAIVTLVKAEEKARLNYISCAEDLSTARLACAEQLDTAVSAELPALKLGKASFKTEVQKLPESDWSETGMNRVAFLVSTNKGMPLAPIHKVASGGELSRFMLALKVNLAGGDDIDTLVFDEVDSGIGGATADAVGARLKRLAQNHQVLVVTHSPQVAAYGSAHLTVHKTEDENRTFVMVETLKGESRQNEVARMLSGEKITRTAMQMAKELLETCSKK